MVFIGCNYFMVFIRFDYNLLHILVQEQNKILVLENKLSDQLKLEDLHHAKAAAHVQLLARTVCYLRAQFSGTVPLQRQQRLSEAVRALVAEKQELNKRVVQVSWSVFRCVV